LGRYGRYRTYYRPIWFETVIDRRAEAPAVSAIPAITTHHYEGDQPPDRLLAIRTDSDQFGRVAQWHRLALGEQVPAGPRVPARGPQWSYRAAFGGSLRAASAIIGQGSDQGFGVALIQHEIELVEDVLFGPQWRRAWLVALLAARQLGAAQYLW
jgi:hypothetical protein